MYSRQTFYVLSISMDVFRTWAEGGGVQLPSFACRKQSSGDLQSRLKSRKILGVGATDDGLDIHRSKVSNGASHVCL